MPRATVLDADGVRRAVTRIAHEIVERNAGLREVSPSSACRPAEDRSPAGWPTSSSASKEHVRRSGSSTSPSTTNHIGLRPVLPEAVTDIAFDITGLTVVLVDDVLFTGRTVRAALNALADYGRARACSWP